MKIEELRKKLKKHNIKVKTKTVNLGVFGAIGVFGTFYFPNGNNTSGNVFSKQDEKYLDIIRNIIKSEDIFRNDEKVITGF